MSVANRAYLDMKYDNATPIGLNWAANIEVRDSYEWDPADVAPGIAESALAGVEAPVWTETLANMRDVEFMAFPRLLSLAEIAWTPGVSAELGELSSQARRTRSAHDRARHQLLPCGVGAVAMSSAARCRVVEV